MLISGCYSSRTVPKIRGLRPDILSVRQPAGGLASPAPVITAINSTIKSDAESSVCLGGGGPHIIARLRVSRTDVKVAPIFLRNIVGHVMMYHIGSRCQIGRFIGISTTLVWPASTGGSRAFSISLAIAHSPQSNRISRVFERVERPALGFMEQH